MTIMMVYLKVYNIPQYNFGKIETNSLEFITDVPVWTREMNTSNLSGVNFNVGAMYQTNISKKLNLD